MREIIFRGKSKNSNEWVQGGILQTENWAEIYVPHDSYGDITEPPLCDVGIVEVYPETVGQYTGLTDKNGRKIFEGDILKSFLGKRTILSTVKYGAFRPDFFYACAQDQGYDINKKIYGLFLKDNNSQELMFAEDMHLAEVIGNIYDNPELLEGGADD